MKRFIRGLAIATAVIAPALVSIAPSAQAATANAFTQNGGGTISPGLQVAPGTAQTFSFAGTGTGVGTGGVASVANCTASGNDTIGSIAAGQGNVAITCTVGSNGPTTAACVYVRVGAVVLVACLPGTITVGAGGCVFVTTQTPPVTSYLLVCAGIEITVP